MTQQRLLFTPSTTLALTVAFGMAGCKFGPSPVYLNDETHSGAGATSILDTTRPEAGTGGATPNQTGTETPGSGGQSNTTAETLGSGGRPDTTSEALGSGGRSNTTSAVVVAAGNSAGGVAAGGGAAGGAATGGAPVVTCRPPKSVATVAEIVAEVVALGSRWEFKQNYLSSSTTITDDLLATADITLQASDIPAPTNYVCTSDAGLCSTEEFDNFLSVPIVSASTLVLTAGTTFRLRPFILDLHPVNPWGKLLVEVRPPCTAPCGDGEQRCAIDAVCYPVGEIYCAYCEKRSREICACVQPTEDVVRFPDARPANFCDYLYLSSNDNIFSGTCQNGICKN